MRGIGLGLGTPFIRHVVAGFNPTRVEGLLGWYDTADAVDAGGGVLDNIPARYGEGPALAAAGSPAIEASGWGDSSQSVQFDPANSDYATVDGLAPNFSGIDKPFTLVMRGEILTWADYGMLFSVGRSTTGNPAHYLCMRVGTPPGKWESFRKDDAGTGVTRTGATDASANTGVKTIVQVFDGTQVSLYVNGAAAGITNPTAQDVGDMTVDQCTLFAYRRNTTSLYGHVRLRAAGFYSAAISDANRQSLEEWIAAQYPAS